MTDDKLPLDPMPFRCEHDNETRRLSMAKIYTLQGSEVEVTTTSEMVTIQGSGDRWFQFTRRHLLAAIGAVDAPIEVPTKPFAVISAPSGSKFVNFPEGWRDHDGNKIGVGEIRLALLDGGTILSEGVEQ